MSLNIKDQEVHEMARKVAATHGISMSGAVKEALREKIEKDQAALDSAPRKKKVLELLMEFVDEYRSRVKDPIHSWEMNDYLYDEIGLPK